MVTGMTEVDQGVQTAVGAYQDMTAVTAITAVRSPFGDELLAPEAHAAVAAVPRLDLDHCLIDEFHRTSP